MLDRRAYVGANRRMNQGWQVMLEIRFQQVFDGGPYQIHDGVQIARLILDRPPQLLQRRFNGAALGMSQYHHQACPELLGGEFHAPNEGRGNDVAGDANDEQVSQSLIKDDFNGYARIGTTENGGEWLLTRGQLETAPATRYGIAVAHGRRHEAAVALLQQRERFPSQNHRGFTLVALMGVRCLMNRLTPELAD